MNAVAANRAFELDGVIQHLFGGRVILVLLTQIGVFFNANRQRNVPALVRRRHQLSQAVALGVRHFQHPGDIAHRHAAEHLTKGSDITNMVFAVLFSAIFNHFVAASILDINVDIRHGNTIWIEETLKQQTILQRIKVGNIQCVGDNRSGGATPARAKNNSFRFTPVNKVLNNQEVTLITHIAHHAQLHLGALANFVG